MKNNYKIFKKIYELFKQDNLDEARHVIKYKIDFITFIEFNTFTVKQEDNLFISFVEDYLDNYF